MNFSRMVNNAKQKTFGIGLIATAAFLSSLAWMSIAALEGDDILRVTPLSLSLTSDSTLPAEVKAQEALTVKNLFDRDTTTEFTAFAANTTRIQLNGVHSIDSLKIYGPSAYKLTVRYFSQGSWQSVNEWTNLDLSTAANEWQSFTTKNSFETEALELALIPDVVKGKSKNAKNVTISAAIKELAFWGKGKRTLISNVATLDAVLHQDTVTPPAYVKSYAATPEQVLVSSQGASFSVSLPYSPNSIEKVWLSYEANGLSHWVSAKRQINGHTAIGGDYLFTHNEWKTLYEPIHPQWLNQGTNTISFSLPSEVAGSYRIRNLRLLVLLDDGAHFEQSYSASPQSSLNDSALSHDGNTDTGWQPFLNATEKNEKPYLQIDFEKSMQLDHLRLYALNKINGSINVDVLVDDNWITGSNAIAGGQINSGWNTFGITSTSAVKAVRLTFTDNGKSNLEIREILPVASGVGVIYEPQVTVTYPQNGEYYGRSAYIRGYLNVEDNGSGKAKLFIGGKEVTYDAGEFAALISKEDVQLSDQADDIAWQVTVEAVYPDDTKLTKVVYLNKYADSSETEGTLPYAVAKATPTDDKLIEFDEASLELTEGALDKPVEIKITSLKHDDLPALDPGMTNVTRGPRRGYRFTPHGSKFKKNIKVTIPYDENLIPAGMGVTDIKTYFFDEETGRWVPLEKVGIDKKKKRLISNTDHFTDMINATITVPDSPQAASFNPTQIKDIKAADPGAGINLIEPPQANNQGSANLSYPIEIPAGRNGMQPQLAIQYNSGGGNGWLGLGWDLSVPSITIDTRWGVPRYSTSNETESYMLAGQQLTPLAHRQDQDNLPARQANKDDFRLRVVGSFQKIKRHGTLPTNYWWEVTDKNGTRYFYGSEGNGQTASAVLGGSKGVFKWMLKKTIDTNGNTIVYNYDKVCDTGIGTGGCATGVKGYQLYLSSVDYTGHTSKAAPYHIEFKRDTQLGEPRRPDVSIDARGGFKQVTSQLLKQIIVKFNSENVRSYDLEYEKGAFNKTRLKNLIQLASDGTTEFNRHQFDYFDDLPRQAENDYRAFQPVPSVTLEGDGIESKTFAGKTFRQTVLGGSFGSNTGYNGSFGITFPFLATLASGNSRHSGNSSRSETKTALMDMDGDGKADKVFLKGGSVKYRKNLTQPNDTNIIFSEEVYDTYLSKLNETTSNSSTTGFNGYAFGGTAFRQMITTTSTDKAYFSDVNGDGIIDHVNNGLVKFGYLSPQGIRFNTDSIKTDNPIDGGAMASTDIFAGLADEENELKERNPLMDAVRRWVAPYDGYIKVSGTVQLHDYFSDNTLEDYERDERINYKTDDGVAVAIQINNDEIWRARIRERNNTAYQYYDERLEYTASPASSLNRLKVNKGDKIYFRVMSIDDGSYDRVNWSPDIQYINTQNIAKQFLDVNNRNVYRYNTTTDTVFSGQPSQVPAPYDGTIHFTGVLDKAITTDDVKLKINIYEYNEEAKQYSASPKTGQGGSYTLSIPWNENKDYPIDIDLSVDYHDKIVINFEADSPIDLSALKWKVQPSMYYTEATRREIEILVPPEEDDDTPPEDKELPVDNSDIKNVDISTYESPEEGPTTRPAETIPTTEVQEDGTIKYLVQLPVNFNANIYSGNNLDGTVQQPWKARASKDGHLLITPWLNVTTKENLCRIKLGDDYDGWFSWGNHNECKDIPVTPDGTVTFTVKKRGELLYKQTISIAGEQVVSSTIGYDALTVQHVQKNDELFFDFTSSNQLLASRITQSKVHAEYGSDTSWLVPFSDGVNVYVESHISDSRDEDSYGYQNNSSDVLILVRENNRIIATKKVTLQPATHYNIRENLNISVAEGSNIQYDVFSVHPYHTIPNGNTHIWTRYLGASEWHVPKSGKISVTPKLSFKNAQQANGDLILKAYQNNQFVGERKYTVTAGQLSPVNPSEFNTYPLSINAIKDRNIRVEYWTHSHALSSLLSNKGEFTVNYTDNLVWKVPGDNDTLTHQLNILAQPVFDFAGTKPNGEITFKVLNGEQLLGEQVFSINNGQLVSPAKPLSLTVKETDVLSFNFNVKDEILLPYLNSHTVNVSIDGAGYFIVNSNFNALDILKPINKLHIYMPRKVQVLPVQSSARHYPETDNMFGEAYRGWAQAAYLGNNSRANSALNETDFIISDNQSEADQFNSNAYPAIPDFPNKRWGSSDGAWHIANNYIKSTRRGLKYINLPQPEDFERDDTQARTAGIVRVPRFSLTKGYSDGGGYVLTLSRTRSTGNGKLDLMDLNGDRYPDIITSGSVQYTKPDGRMGELKSNVATRITSSTDKTLSFGGGTEAPVAPNSKLPRYNQKPGNPSNISISGSLGKGKSDGVRDYIDINGDGLLDRVSPVSGGLNVELNNGYGFESAELWKINTQNNVINVNKGTSDTYGFSVGWSMPGTTFSGGINVNMGVNDVSSRLMDVNGDGLTDYVYVSGNFIKVALNTGGGFAKAITWGEPLKTLDDISLLGNYGGALSPVASHTSLSDGMSSSVGLSANVTVGVTVICGFFPCFDIVGGGGGNYGQTVGQPTVSFSDINGDGYVDSLQSGNDGDLNVKLSKIGRTNLLKSVSRPLGGKFEIDYKRTGNTYNLPSSRWVMSKVSVFDGAASDTPSADRVQGSDFRAFKFNYQNGKHDRFEREFLGFANVVQEELNTKGVHLVDGTANESVFNDSIKTSLESASVFRKVTQTYLNNSFYTKGLLAENVTQGRQNTDGTGTLVNYRKSESKYVLRHLASGTELDDLTSSSQQALLKAYIDSGATLFPYPAKSTQYFYEGGSTYKSTSTENKYDDYGNVIVFKDLGEPNINTDDVTANIIYSHTNSSCLDKNITGKPTQIVVTSNQGEVRKRQADYYCGTTGNLKQIRQYLKDGSSAVTKLELYDDFGNLKKVTGPANNTNQTLSMSFDYDSATQTYPVYINNESYNIASSAKYDYKFGKPLCTLDVNGNPMTYKYDSFGRATRITGPYELPEGFTCASAANDSAFTIKFTYQPYVDLDAARTYSVAKTEHYNRDANKVALPTINTWLFTDGIKRVLQTKKTAEVDQAGTIQVGQIVSGRVSFDALGRSIKQYYPTFETGGANPLAFNTAVNPIQPTAMTYDALDRNVSTILPDNTQTSIAYGFGQFSGGSLSRYFMTTITDANGKQKTTYRDVRELINAVKEEGNLLTTYKYDALKQITDVYDAENNNTHVEYDNLGRRKLIRNPDTGETKYKYDLASNLVEKITANREGKVGIKYVYDHTRLLNINYPTYPDNNVSYIYGDSSHKNLNQAGRIIQVTHQGGTDTREYGKLGEVTKEIRVLNAEARGNGPVPTYVTQYDFDTFGRLMKLTLPDTEVITHGYNAGGQVNTISGSLHGSDYAYLKNLTYDEFEQRRSLTLGNGIQTQYHYDPQHRRLCRLESGLTLNQASSNAQGCETFPRVVNSDEQQNALASQMAGLNAAPKGQFQNINYAYDNVGNILGMTNATAIPRRSDMGGPTVQTFRYDNLYRLSSAKGQFSNAQSTQHKYTLAMQYSGIHNILKKTQEHTFVRSGGNARIQRATTYDWNYTYKDNGHTQPHAPTHIGNRTFSYDKNGNQLGWDNDDNGQRRSIEWDDENRIQKIGDPQNTLTFAYDDGVTRVLKRGKLGQTAYVNQFFTVRNFALASKHIFAGTSRIATKLEPGQPVGTNPSYSTTDTSTVTFTTATTQTVAKNKGQAKKAEKVEQRSFIERVTSFFTGEDEKTHPGKGVEKRSARANEVAQNTVKNKHLNGGTLPSGNNAGGNGNNGNNSNNGNDNTNNGNGGNSANNGNSGGGTGSDPLAHGGTFLYYYHPDHLGSTGYVTDEDAELYEHIEYFPFGETWVSENTSSRQRIPYSYTSKELDEETGLYYYGARYYDPRTSVWQSVDPVIGRYLDGSGENNGVYNSSNLAMFTYTHQNPLVMIDPDGREPNKSQAITWDQAKVIIKKHFKSNTTSPNLHGLRYTDQAATGKQVGPFGGSKGGRYIWTKKGGWIDLGHFFSVATQADIKTQEKANEVGLTKGLTKLGGKLFKKGEIYSKLWDATKKVEESQTGETKWSYEDGPSNKAGTDFYLDYYSDDDNLVEGLDDFFNDMGASNPSDSPNWKTMQQGPQTKRRFKQNKSLQPMLNPQLDKSEK